MSINSALFLIGTLAALATVVPLLIFIVLYAWKSPWRSTELGIALMFQKVTIFLLIAIGILQALFPENCCEPSPRLGVRALLFIALVALLSLDVVNLRRAQTHSKKKSILMSRFVKRYPTKRR